MVNKTNVEPEQFRCREWRFYPRSLPAGFIFQRRRQQHNSGLRQLLFPCVGWAACEVPAAKLHKRRNQSLGEASSVWLASWIFQIPKLPGRRFCLRRRSGAGVEPLRLLMGISLQVVS